jgi:uncharacterized protein (TIGR03118 family)
MTAATGHGPGGRRGDASIPERSRVRFGVGERSLSGGIRRRAGGFVAGCAVSVMLVSLALATPAVARGAMHTKKSNAFASTVLVADNSSFSPKLTDGNLTNAWGLAFFPGGPLWVSDNNSGNATAYTGGVKGSAVSRALTVPVPGGNPSGQVYNDVGGFPTGGPSGPSAIFIVNSDSIGPTQSPGEIAAWDGGSSFVVEDSPTGGPGGTTPAGAVFKGLAIAQAAAGPELFATDVANAKVDVFNSNFSPMSTPREFVDPAIPAGYTPFGIQMLKGNLYVTYGLQNAQKNDVVPGPGLGYVDIYSVNGTLIKHLIVGGGKSPLNEPWGLAIAPKHFGRLSGKLLVGNLGNGVVNAFNPKNGKPAGTLLKANGQPLVIDGLWGLVPGTSSFGGPGTVIYSAGPNNYADGTLGIIANIPQFTPVDSARAASSSGMP